LEKSRQAAIRHTKETKAKALELMEKHGNRKYISGKLCVSLSTLKRWWRARNTLKNTA